MRGKPALKPVVAMLPSPMMLYVNLCRTVMKADPSDPDALMELNNFMPFLRQSLSCLVCARLIQNPMRPPHNNCKHIVCQRCIGGRMRLKPKCSWCRDQSVFIKDSQLKSLVNCYVLMCEYVNSCLSDSLRSASEKRLHEAPPIKLAPVTPLTASDIFSMVREGVEFEHGQEEEREAEQSELIDHIEELGLEEFDGFVIAGVEVVEREVEDLAGGVVTVGGMNRGVGGVDKFEVTKGIVVERVEENGQSDSFDKEDQTARVEEVSKIEGVAEEETEETREQPANQETHCRWGSGEHTFSVKSESDDASPFKFETPTSSPPPKNSPRRRDVSPGVEPTPTVESVHTVTAAKDLLDVKPRLCGSSACDSSSPSGNSSRNSTLDSDDFHSDDLQSSNDEFHDAVDVKQEELPLLYDFAGVIETEAVDVLVKTSEADPESLPLSSSLPTSFQEAHNYSLPPEFDTTTVTTVRPLSPHPTKRKSSSLSDISSKIVTSSPSKISSPAKKIQLVSSFDRGSLDLASCTSATVGSSAVGSTGTAPVDILKHGKLKRVIARIGVTGVVHPQPQSQSTGYVPLPSHHSLPHSTTMGRSPGPAEVHRSRTKNKEAKKGGCRCGLATQTPGQLTCCGQRCPCYVGGERCVDCRCRGCRNPYDEYGNKRELSIQDILRSATSNAIVSEASAGTAKAFLLKSPGQKEIHHPSKSKIL